jgi:glycosyltransferase involved in cell wall biosynthesis
MKIALYAPAWPPGLVANGIVTYASHLVPALRRLGHEVFVLTCDPGESTDPHTINIRRFSPKPNILNKAWYQLAPEAAHYKFMSTTIARAIRYLVEHHQIDVFEIEESFGWSTAVSQLNLVPVVVRLHGPHFLMGRFDREYKNNKINQRRQQLEGRCIRQAHYVTANCAETLNAVRLRYELSLTNSRIIPNPINAAAESEAWSINSCSRDSLLFVGRFDKVKGGDLILRAFASLAASRPGLRLTFVGPDRGIEIDNGQICSFHDFVTQTFPEDVHSRIDFRGHMTHADVMSLRTQHFLTLIGAQYDTMGYMMMEAMSLGCPMVSTAVGGIPEYIKDKRNGLLVPSQDSNAMATACNSLLEDGTLAASLGRQAWLDCSQLYNYENVAAQMTSTYRVAIDKFKSERQARWSPHRVKTRARN